MYRQSQTSGSNMVVTVVACTQVAQLSGRLNAIPPRHAMLAAFKQVLSRAPTEVQDRAATTSELKATSDVQGLHGDRLDTMPVKAQPLVENIQAEELTQAMGRLHTFVSTDTPAWARDVELPDLDALMLDMQEQLLAMGFDVGMDGKYNVDQWLTCLEPYLSGAGEV